MATLTEVVAAVVVQSSVAAFSHFGVTLEPQRAEAHPMPAVERTVARTPPPANRPEKLQRANGQPAARPPLVSA